MLSHCAAAYSSRVSLHLENRRKGSQVDLGGSPFMRTRFEGAEKRSSAKQGQDGQNPCIMPERYSRLVGRRDKGNIDDFAFVLAIQQNPCEAFMNCPGGHRVVAIFRH